MIMRAIITLFGFVCFLLLMDFGSPVNATHYSVGKDLHDDKNKHHQKAEAASIHTRKRGHSHELNLDKKNKQLLRREMQLISASMIEILEAIPSGDWDAVHQAAGKIHQAELLKQGLSAAEKKSLADKLPHGFIKLDHRFHYLAGMLSHVAEERDYDLVNFYFYKMNETCMACHKKFASKKFPGLGEPNKHEAKHGGGHH